ncbi:MAG TPA: substrate-binding domain-containing protein [Kofleriaceae bacterium]|nr:substrate-binding domain-containing protein [Kofleriaceae bacterium]
MTGRARRLALAALALALAAAAAVGCRGASEAPERPAPATIRVAVIGGMIETGLWAAVAERYERLTGHKVELAASGPKHQVVAAFRRGGIDLITVHASDAMVNLVADGLARDPQPWARNDLVIVGPAADPAGVRGARDAVAALGKIIAAKAPLLVHASLGADGVLHDLREEGRLVLDREATLLFSEDNQHKVLERAAAAGAYTMVGRIPFLSKKLFAPGIELMVAGDPRLRRPYLVEVAATAGPAARDLAAFLRQREVQALLATFGKGKYDDQPLFFPVVVPEFVPE